MSDEPRRDRGLPGPATLARIDGLADGWVADAAPGEAARAAQRPKRKSLPPPPPGAKKQRPSTPMEATVPYARVDPPAKGKTAKGTGEAEKVSMAPGDAPLDDAVTARAALARPAAPASAAATSFDDAVTRRARRPRADVAAEGASTDAAAVANGTPVPEPSTPGAAAAPIAATSQREASETVVVSPAQAAAVPRPVVVGAGAASLRLPAGLPRERGLLGDLRYVYTVVFGLARAHRQYGETRKLIDEVTTTRDIRLIDIGRTAVGDERLSMPIVEKAREELLDIEERRSMRAGQIAACDEDLSNLTLEYGKERVAREEALIQLRAELSRQLAELGPLEKQLHIARRRGQRLGSQLGALDERIRGQRVTVPPPGQPGAAQAAIASLRAERNAIAAEEPKIASEIDQLEPAVAALRSEIAERERKVTRIEQDARDAEVRTAEIRTAILARKAVEERAVADLARAQTDALRGLGERLVLERPAELHDRLLPVERAELRLAELHRRKIELGELVGAVNRRALARGASLAAGALLALILLVVLIA